MHAQSGHGRNELILTFSGAADASLLTGAHNGLSKRVRRPLDQAIPKSFYDINLGVGEYAGLDREETATLTLVGDASKACVKGLVACVASNLRDIPNPELDTASSIDAAEKTISVLAQIAAAQI